MATRATDVGEGGNCGPASAGRPRIDRASSLPAAVAPAQRVESRIIRTTRTLAKLVFLAGIALVNVPLALASLSGRRRGVRPTPRAPVLIVTPFTPGQESGSAKAVEDLAALLRRRHEVRLAVTTELPRSARLTAALSSVVVWPLGVPRQCRSLLFLGQDLPWNWRPNAVVLFESFAAALAIYLRRPGGSWVVLRDHEVLIRKINMERRAARGLESLVHAARLASCYLISNAVYRHADRVIALTDEDRDALLRWFPSLVGRTLTLPVPFEVSGAAPRVASAAGASRDMLMVGNFFHRPNVDALRWFLTACAPHLDPGFRLHLCGLDAPLDDVDLSSPHVDLVRHGFVQDLANAVPGPAIAVAAVISGGGVRMKNLLLASLGHVVVTTPLGNQGIGFVDGVHAVVTDDGREMARRINLLVCSPGQMAEMGARARALVRARFGPAGILDRIEDGVFSSPGAPDRESAEGDA